MVKLGLRLAHRAGPLSGDCGRSRKMSGERDVDILIRTSLKSPVAICLAESLLEEAGIPFFTMDQTPAGRPDCMPSLGSWSVRVPIGREGEAREIVRTVEEIK
jgi:hypothetical protein